MISLGKPIPGRTRCPSGICEFCTNWCDRVDKHRVHRCDIHKWTKRGWP